MDWSKSIFEFLTSPQPVADFQRFCSIRAKIPKGTCGITTVKGVQSDESELSSNISDGRTKEYNHCSVPNGYCKTDATTDNNILRKRLNGLNKLHDANANGIVLNGRHGHSTSSYQGKYQKPSETDYEIGNYLIFLIFRFGAELGNELFYLIFYTFSMWNFDSFVTQKVAVVWVLCMYVGQALKDIIRWPRPASPPVFQLEQRYALEYGMPSTHAIVGTAIPFLLLIYTVDRYDYSYTWGLTAAITWCSLVCLSRLYLGMHTILDIMAGLLLVTIMMSFLAPLSEPTVHFLVKYKYGGILSVGAAIFLATFYPSSDKWSTARGDTCVFLGVTSGILFGSWLNYQQGLLVPVEVPLPYTNNLWNFDWLEYGMYRMVIGVLAAMFIRLFVKTITFKSLCLLLNKDPKDPITKKTASVEVPYCYISYFSLAFCSTYVAPLLFMYFNILRPTYYTEFF